MGQCALNDAIYKRAEQGNIAYGRQVIPYFTSATSRAAGVASNSSAFGDVQTISALVTYDLNSPESSEEIRELCGNRVSFGEHRAAQETPAPS